MTEQYAIQQHLVPLISVAESSLNVKHAAAGALKNLCLPLITHEHLLENDELLEHVVESLLGSSLDTLQLAGIGILRSLARSRGTT